MLFSRESVIIPESKNRRIDLLLSILFLGAGFFQSMRLSGRLDPAMMMEPKTRNVWFDADMIRVTSLETDRGGRHARSNIHPLVSMVSFPPVFLLRHLFGVPNLTAVRVFHSVVAGVWAALLFLLLRRLGCLPADSALFTVLAGTSAAAYFWLWVPETYALGSLSFFPALYFAAGKNRPTLVQQVAAQVAGISVTVTNWMAGALLTIAAETRRRIFIVAGAAGASVLGMCLVQSVIFPKARLPLAGVASTAAPFFFMPESGGFWPCARAFLFHSMSAPAFSWYSNFRLPTLPLISFQSSPLFSGPISGGAASALWAVLLGTSLVILVRRPGPGLVRVVLGMTIVAQFTLHVMFGRETFLYSLHYVPLLVIAAALATQTRARRGSGDGGVAHRAQCRQQ